MERRVPAEVLKLVRNRIIEFGRNIYRSIFRYGRLPEDAEGQSYVVFNSLFLHIHSVKVRQRSLQTTYTFGLGIIATFLFVILGLTGVGWQDQRTVGSASCADRRGGPC